LTANTAQIDDGQSDICRGVIRLSPARFPSETPGKSACHPFKVMLYFSGYGVTQDLHVPVATLRRHLLEKGADP
jgi:hypothetical protein